MARGTPVALAVVAGLCVWGTLRSARADAEHMVRVGLTWAASAGERTIGAWEGEVELGAEGAVRRVLAVQEVARVAAVGDELMVDGGDGERVRRLAATARTGLIALGGEGLRPRPYRGRVEISAADGRLRVVNVVELEDYVRSVVPTEMPRSFPLEALIAQAILARTYALRAVGKHKRDGFDLCDSTHCQDYRGVLREAPETDAAVDHTRGLVLTFADELAEVVYHSTCGGHTAAAWEVWQGAKRLSYLGGVSDELNGAPACALSPRLSWSAEVSLGDLAHIARAAGADLGTPSGLVVTRRSANGRAAGVEVSSAAGQQEMGGYDFYLRCGRVLGWGVVRSAWFDVSAWKRGWRLTGRGSGHGVGLCQWGARGRAQAGATAVEILAAYFPGTRVRRMEEVASCWERRTQRP